MSKMSFGRNELLEDEADRLIKESLEGVHSHKAKSDILTPWKTHNRARRQVQVTLSPNPHFRQANDELLGQPDKSMRQGIFNRVYNTGRPDLNSRDCIAPVVRTKKVPRFDAGYTFSDDRDTHTITLTEYRLMVEDG